MSNSFDPTFAWGSVVPESIVVMRSLPGLGDFLCIIPALRALRRAFPSAHLAVIGLSHRKSLMSRFSCYIDEWLPFPGYPGIPEMPVSPQQTVKFLADLQQRHVGLALQLHGSGLHINSFVRLLGATCTAGFFPMQQTNPDPQFFLPYQEQESEVTRHLRLLRFLGIQTDGTHLEFPLNTADWQEFEEIAENNRLQNSPYICIHPGASSADRRWPYWRFATVADYLAQQGYRIVLTGSESEADLTQAVALTMQHPAIDLAGKTSLGSLAALLQRSALLVCNDTGVSHLAAALGTKSVVIFCASDPDRWAPLATHTHRTVRADDASASHSSLEAVLHAVDQQLQQEELYAS